MLEASVQQRARLAMAQLGGLPQRNNVGACEDKTGRIIRYGLMNSSAQENRQFASSDLIGPIPIVIQPHHVGRTVGVYAAFECKKSDWRFQPGDARAAAQLRYIQLVQGVGGIGGFVSDPAHVEWYVREWLQAPSVQSG